MLWRRKNDRLIGKKPPNLVGTEEENQGRKVLVVVQTSVAASSAWSYNTPFAIHIAASDAWSYDTPFAIHIAASGA